MVNYKSVMIYITGTKAKLLQPSLMFVGKAMSLPMSVASEKGLSWVGSGLACKH